MENKQSIEEWEKAQGIMFTGKKVDPTEVITAHQFRDLCAANNHVEVNYKNRIAFLNENNYDTSRENILNEDLQAQPPEEEEGAGDGETKSGKAPAKPADTPKPKSKSEQRRIAASKKPEKKNG